VAVRRGSLPAAYGGRGWRPRQGTLADDIREGKIWTRCASNSECGRLEKVVLYWPPAGTPAPADPNSAQHLERVDWAVIAEEMGHVSECFRRLGVDVLTIRPRGGRAAFKPERFPNMIYVRDLFFMTPEGAIVSRMASSVRAGEESHLARTLADHGTVILGTIGGAGTFEGADALWLDRRTVLIGLDNRTNAAGFDQVSSLLRRQGVSCTPVPLSKRVQHLLGCLQIVDGDMAVVRGGVLPKDALRALAEKGYKTVPLPEGDEVTRRQAMNLVTVSPRRVVMAAGCPRTKRALKKAGIEIAAELKISGLTKAAGGLGCATGVLSRRLV
jgi:N-dimethylarginine dimethylaminohydrolase